MLSRAIIYFIGILLLNNVALVYAEDVLHIPEKKLTFRTYEGSRQQKSMQIYGLSNETEIEISSSHLSSIDSSASIESNKVKINGYPIFNTTLNDGEVEDIVVTVSPDKAGIFTGGIIVQNNKNNSIQNIPIMLDVAPVWPLYIVIFLLGFGISWIFWSWSRKEAAKERFLRVRDRAKEIEWKFNAFEEFLKQTYSFLMLQDFSFRKLRQEMYHSNVNDAEKIIEDLFQGLSKLIESDNFDQSKVDELASALQLSPGNFIARIIGAKSPSNAMALNLDNSAVQEANFNYWKYLRNRPNSLLYNVSAILLGIIIGLGTLFQQQGANLTYSYELKNILYLFALGAGADSIKQIAERIFYKET